MQGVSSIILKYNKIVNHLFYEHSHGFIIIIALKYRYMEELEG